MKNHYYVGVEIKCLLDYAKFLSLFNELSCCYPSKNLITTKSVPSMFVPQGSPCLPRNLSV